MSQYNAWHTSHQDDNDISAPWHRFVQASLQGEDLRGKTILEIGCGRGGFSSWMAGLTCKPSQIFACDYSSAALDIARNRYEAASSNIYWKKEDIMNLSFKDGTFDFGVSCETIEHVVHPYKAIQELYRVLKPGGLLFLTCPNYFNFFGLWCIYRWVIGKPFTEGGQPYVNYVLFPLVYWWIKRAGFTIKMVRTSELIIPSRYPKQYWNEGIPALLRPLGYRTFYILRK